MPPASQCLGTGALPCMNVDLGLVIHFELFILQGDLQVLFQSNSGRQSETHLFIEQLILILAVTFGFLQRDSGVIDNFLTQHQFVLLHMHVSGKQ